MNHKSIATDLREEDNMSPLVKFILMFADKLGDLDQICDSMTSALQRTELQELYVDTLVQELHTTIQLPSECTDLRCNCWKIVPITKRFLDAYNDARSHRRHFMELKEQATTYINNLKQDDSAQGHPPSPTPGTEKG